MNEVPITRASSGANVDTGLEAVLLGVRAAIEQDLEPNVRGIDEGGEYPAKFMRRLGAEGGYRQGAPAYLGGDGRGLGATIRVIEEVSKTCLSTGFCVWCQTVCAWYIQNGESGYLKERVLPGLLDGQTLGGTGLSNPMKHFAGIENIKVSARRHLGGYVLNGVVPWVSNVGAGSPFAVVAGLKGEDEYVAALVPAGAPGLKLGNGGHFIALEGSSTHSAVLRDVLVSKEHVLASIAGQYVDRIRDGFVLTQTGFGLGLVDACIGLMKKSNIRAINKKSGVNGFLEDQAEDIEMELRAARRRIYVLAGEMRCSVVEARTDIFQEVLRARVAISELSLRASRAAMLHMGAVGYRSGSTAERRLRESYFVAIVTPSLKHLKKMLHDLKTGG